MVFIRLPFHFVILACRGDGSDIRSGVLWDSGRVLEVARRFLWDLNASLRSIFIPCGGRVKLSQVGISFYPCGFWALEERFQRTCDGKFVLRIGVILVVFWFCLELSWALTWLSARVAFRGRCHGFSREFRT